VALNTRNKEERPSSGGPSHADLMAQSQVLEFEGTALWLRLMLCCEHRLLRLHVLHHCRMALKES
jgi:hypothetical protein